MYPLDIFALFPPFPRDYRVFVIMPFGPKWDARWRDVIMPSVAKVEMEGTALEAFRADTRRVGNSILTEIVTAITTSRLIFADVTTIAIAEGNPVRNGNVMYELGMAHSRRLPEEVLLFRSDHDPLLFDVAAIRVNTYSPEEDVPAAQETIARSLQDSIAELDLRRHAAVGNALQSLSFHALGVLFTLADKPEGVTPPRIRKAAHVLRAVTEEPAIQRLLELGLASARLLGPERLDAPGPGRQENEEYMRYVITPFGQAVMEAAYENMGIEALQRQLRESEAAIRKTIGDEASASTS